MGQRAQGHRHKEEGREGGWFLRPQTPCLLSCSAPHGLSWIAYHKRMTQGQASSRAALGVGAQTTARMTPWNF